MVEKKQGVQIKIIKKLKNKIILILQTHLLQSVG